MDTIQYDEIQSKKWDMDIPLEALVDYNEGKCLMDLNYKAHRYDDCFSGYMLYFTHPNIRNVLYNTMIGITDDGFTYIGEGNPPRDAKEIKFEYGMNLMIAYKDFLSALRNYEDRLSDVVKESYINVLYKTDYSIESRENTGLNFK